jgi:hypothetical protein
LCRRFAAAGPPSELPVPADHAHLLFDACPVGTWPAVALLTALGVMGFYPVALGKAVVALFAGALAVATAVGVACLYVCLAVVALLFVLFVLFAALAWFRDD